VLVDWTAAGSEEVLHYVRDALGSVVGLLDAGQPDATPEPVPARLVERYDYDPYGNQTGVAGTYEQPFRFSSRYHDAETGLGHWGYRYYSARLGRWLSRERFNGAAAGGSGRAVRPLRLSADHGNAACEHHGPGSATIHRRLRLVPG
jgi:RHS repeat-associated protein